MWTKLFLKEDGKERVDGFLECPWCIACQVPDVLVYNS